MPPYSEIALARSICIPLIQHDGSDPRRALYFDTSGVTGTVASAGTLIAMACSSLAVSPHVSFMIHNYSGGMAGKGHEMKARQKFTDDHLNEAFTSFYSGFLSKDEMEKVIEGTDIWMTTPEVNTRWEQRVAYVKGKAND